MASVVLTDAEFNWNSVDLSAFTKSVTVNYEAEMQDETAMGDTTRINLAGLKIWSMDVALINDEAASAVAQTLFADVGVSRTVLIRPSSAAVSATNPNYTGSGILQSVSPVSGSVGDLNQGSIRIVSAGALSRATS